MTQEKEKDSHQPQLTYLLRQHTFISQFESVKKIIFTLWLERGWIWLNRSKGDLMTTIRILDNGNLLIYERANASLRNCCKITFSLHCIQIFPIFLSKSWTNNNKTTFCTNSIWRKFDIIGFPFYIVNSCCHRAIECCKNIYHHRLFIFIQFLLTLSALKRCSAHAMIYLNSTLSNYSDIHLPSQIWFFWTHNIDTFLLLFVVFHF